MARIVVTSDLHFDPDGRLTRPEAVTQLAAQIVEMHPDAVVLAGDLGHPLANFVACLDTFRSVDAPIGVLAGNHDVWHDPAGAGSRELWEIRLSEAVRLAGMYWLEDDILRAGDTAIVGSLAWYDYTAAPEPLRYDDEHYARIKAQLNADADWIDWPWSDVEFAGKLREGFRARLARAQRDASVGIIVVVTHVPVFEAQMTRRPGDHRWELSNAYFGNLTTGEVVARFRKVRAVVSGHTHCGRSEVVERPGLRSIETHVVASDYGRPSFVVVEVNDEPSVQESDS